MASSDEFPVQFAGAEYDIKTFLRDHPGGVNTLKNYKGKSILASMEKFGHSSSAYHMLSDFKVSGLVDVNLTARVSENGRIITKEEAGRDLREIAFLEELESRLDWSKPILSQLNAIAPHYDKWVNSAVYRKCRIFENPLLERLTYTPWYMVPMFWIPIISYLGITQYYEHVLCGETCSKDSLSPIQYWFHIFCGIALWTPVEYMFHKCIFHLDPGASLNMIRIQFLLHGIHHKVPFDGLRLVFPPVPAAILGFLIYCMGQMMLSYPLAKLAGIYFGYLIYDMIHYYVHHGSPKAGSYLYAMKRYHSNHHFLNHDKGYMLQYTYVQLADTDGWEFTLTHWSRNGRVLCRSSEVFFREFSNCGMSWRSSQPRFSQDYSLGFFKKGVKGAFRGSSVVKPSVLQMSVGDGDCFPSGGRYGCLPP